MHSACGGTFTLQKCPWIMAMDLYLRLTGLIAAGVALFLAPDDVPKPSSQLISQLQELGPTSHTDNALILEYRSTRYTYIYSY